jgi:hypothetical protein
LDFFEISRNCRFFFSNKFCKLKAGKASVILTKNQEKNYSMNVILDFEITIVYKNTKLLFLFMWRKLRYVWSKMGAFHVKSSTAIAAGHDRRKSKSTPLIGPGPKKDLYTCETALNLAKIETLLAFIGRSSSPKNFKYLWELS